MTLSFDDLGRAHYKTNKWYYAAFIDGKISFKLQWLCWVIATGVKRRCVGIIFTLAAALTNRHLWFVGRMLPLQIKLLCFILSWSSECFRVKWGSGWRNLLFWNQTFVSDYAGQPQCKWVSKWRTVSTSTHLLSHQGFIRGASDDVSAKPEWISIMCLNINQLMVSLIQFEILIHQHGVFLIR